MDAKKIGIYLKEKRKTIKLTQVELSEKLGVTHQAISRWETGESVPDVIMLSKLSDLYNVSIDEIVKQECIDIDKLQEKTIDYNKNSILVGTILTIVLYCVSTIVLYFAFLEIDIWIWIILLVTLYVFSTTPYIYFSTNSLEDNQKKNHLRLISDSLIISLVFSVFIAFSKYTEIDILNQNDFNYVFISTGVFLLVLTDYIVRYINRGHSENILSDFTNGIKNYSIRHVVLVTSFLVFIVASFVLFPMLRATDNESGWFGFVYFISAIIVTFNLFYNYKVANLISVILIILNIVTFIYITTLYGAYYGNGISFLDSTGGFLSFFTGMASYLFSFVLIGLFIYRSSKRIGYDVTLILNAIFVFSFATIRTMIQVASPDGYSQTGEHAWILQSDWDRYTFTWIALVLLISLIITVNTIIQRNNRVPID